MWGLLLLVFMAFEHVDLSSVFSVFSLLYGQSVVTAWEGTGGYLAYNCHDCDINNIGRGLLLLAFAIYICVNIFSQHFG